MHGTNPYEDAKAEITPAFPKAEFRVFVLGPSLMPDAVVPKPTIAPRSHDDVVEHAKYLRYATKLALEQEGYPVDFGESEDMLEFWQEHFGARDPGSAEILQADRMSGAIVFYPSSAGSLCELGMFAPQKLISEKSLAIVHKSYENDRSFFRKALIEVFMAQNGRCAFRDYSDHDGCILDATDFVAGKYQSILRDYRTIETADILKQRFHGTRLAPKKYRKRN
jgi:hypothetical protein